MYVQYTQGTVHNSLLNIILWYTVPTKISHYAPPRFTCMHLRIHNRSSTRIIRLLLNPRISFLLFRIQCYQIVYSIRQHLSPRSCCTQCYRVLEQSDAVPPPAMPTPILYGLKSHSSEHSLEHSQMFDFGWCLVRLSKTLRIRRFGTVRFITGGATVGLCTRERFHIR